MTDLSYNTPIYKPQGGVSEVFGPVTFTVVGSNLIVSGLPTSDPHVAGALYSNAGVWTISAGASSSSSSS